MHRSINTNRTRPPRPPPPSREPSSGSGKLQDSDEEDILTEEEEDGVCNIPDQEEDKNLPTSLAKGRVVTNPRLYQLTSLGQSTGLWWDSFEEDLEELGMGGEKTYCLGFTGTSSLFYVGKFILGWASRVEWWLNHLNYLELDLLVPAFTASTIHMNITYIQ